MSAALLVPGGVGKTRKNGKTRKKAKITRRNAEKDGRIGR
jgi:hypothetical protein